MTPAVQASTSATAVGDARLGDGRQPAAEQAGRRGWRASLM